MTLLDNTNTKIVVSRFREDYSFLNKLDFPIIIYEKENFNSKYNVEKNKGNEASAYLKYIVDHYNSLDEYTIFIHCHDFSWHHNGSIINLINSYINLEHTFTNLNNQILGDMEDLDRSNSDIGIFFRKYIRPATGPYVLYPNFTKGALGSAQFIVHKDNILRHSILFYQQIYNWLLDTDIDSRWSSRFLEWTWDLFWNKALKNIPINRYLNEEITNIHIANSYDVIEDTVYHKKDEILRSLEQHNYYYHNDDDILLSINDRTQYVCRNQYIYNKFI